MAERSVEHGTSFRVQSDAVEFLAAQSRCGDAEAIVSLEKVGTFRSRDIIPNSFLAAPLERRPGSTDRRSIRFSSHETLLWS